MEGNKGGTLVKLTFTSHGGSKQTIDAEVGESVMEAAVRNKVDGIEASCGGSMACGTCHAYISEPWFSSISPADSSESAMLEFGIHIRPTSRLCCQVPVTEALEGAEIETPESQVS